MKFKIINKQTKTEVKPENDKEYFIDMYGNVYITDIDDSGEFDLFLQTHLEAILEGNSND